MFGDVLRNRGRTVHRRDNADEIAGADAAGAAVEAHEGAAIAFRQHAPFLDIDAELMLMLGLDNREVVKMHMTACRNELRGDADRLAELADFLTGRDVPDRDLVSAGNLVGGHKTLNARCSTCFHHGARHGDIVDRVEEDDRGVRNGHGRFPGTDFK